MSHFFDAAFGPKLVLLKSTVYREKTCSSSCVHTTTTSSPHSVTLFDMWMEQEVARQLFHPAFVVCFYGTLREVEAKNTNFPLASLQ